MRRLIKIKGQLTFRSISMAGAAVVAVYAANAASTCFAEAGTICDGYSVSDYKEFYLEQYRAAHNGSDPMNDDDFCDGVFGDAWRKVVPTPEPTPTDLNKNIDSVKNPEEFH